VEALIHTAPGGDPLAGVYHRQAMLPLTDAQVAYVLGGQAMQEALEAVIVNRAAISSIVRTEDFLAQRVRQRAALTAEALTSRYPRSEDDLPSWGVLAPSRRAFNALAEPAPRTPAYLPRPQRAGLSEVPRGK
jgi:hypothetical protein